MKTQIRSSVFETNSSSMHSLVILKDNAFNKNKDTHYTKEEIEDSVFYYIDDDNTPKLPASGLILDLSKEDCYYGRLPFKVLDNFMGKWRYAYANYFNDKNKVNKLENIFKKYNPSVKYYKYPEYVGVDEKLLDGWLLNYKITLEEFLTNKKYIVICDGDEYCIFSDIVELGLINKNKCELSLKLDEDSSFDEGCSGGYIAHIDR